MDFLLDASRIFFRWAHVLFAILWVGNSFFFNWLQLTLKMPAKPKEGVEGEVWMLHGGGFFHVEKKELAPERIPKHLHWFKYEAYFTWITGFILLTLVYYFSGGVYLLDPSVSSVNHMAAVHLGPAVLVLGFIFYDQLWRSPLSNIPLLCVAITALFIALTSYGLSQVFASRGAFIHLGAMLGTFMAGNVFFHIIPNQKKMMKAVVSGQSHDPSLSKQAKLRSFHNNYFTLPVIFIMLTNHFPEIYTGETAWITLLVILVTLAIIKHFLNIAEEFSLAIPASIVTGIVGIAICLVLASPPTNIAETVKSWGQIIFRFSHVMAAILWIGNSMFFTWLTMSFRPQTVPEEGVDGECWMLHGGSLWHVKKMPLRPGKIPTPLHWFKWESYSTWLTGFVLLVLLYYHNANEFMIDPSIRELSAQSSIIIGIGSFIVGWLIYDTIFKLKLPMGLRIAMGLGALTIFSLTLHQLLAPRAAYLHLGAMLATCMAANVLIHIIPGQKKMFAEAEAGIEPDPSHSKYAKMRSLHNHYITYAVLFLMLSNHFPEVYSHPLAWLFAVGIFLLGMILKQIAMLESKIFDLMGAGFLATLAGIGTILFLLAPSSKKRCQLEVNQGDGIVLSTLAATGFLITMLTLFSPFLCKEDTGDVIKVEPIPFAKVEKVIAQRCTSCHSKKPTDPIPVPAGMHFDSKVEILRFAPLIYKQAGVGKAMPLGNKTGMKDSERKVLKEWYEQGAPAK